MSPALAYRLPILRRNRIRIRQGRALNRTAGSRRRGWRHVRIFVLAETSGQSRRQVFPDSFPGECDADAHESLRECRPDWACPIFVFALTESSFKLLMRSFEQTDRHVLVNETNRMR